MQWCICACTTTLFAHYIVKGERAIYRTQVHLYDHYIVVDIYSGVYVCARPPHACRKHITQRSNAFEHCVVRGGYD